MVDISALDYRDVIEMQWAGVTWKVAPANSANPQYFDAVMKASELLNGPDKDKSEAREKAERTILASCLAGWSGLSENGKPVEVTADNKLKLLSKPWLAANVRKWANTESEFAPKSAENAAKN